MLIRLCMVLGLVLLVLTGTVLAQDDPGQDLEDAAADVVDATTEAAETTAATAETVLERLVQPPRSDVARVLILIGGIVLLLAGWRIHDLIILIAGFLIGAAVASSLVITDNALINIGILLIGGLIGAALSALVYVVAVFLIGAYVGIALTGGLASALALTPVSPIVLLLGALLGGLILLALSYQFVILLSAVVGAQMITLSLGLDAVWTVILAIIGIVVQLGLTRAFNYDFRRRARQPRFLRRAS
jgi:hypothetical protein